MNSRKIPLLIGMCLFIPVVAQQRPDQYRQKKEQQQEPSSSRQAVGQPDSRPDSSPAYSTGQARDQSSGANRSTNNRTGPGISGAAPESQRQPGQPQTAEPGTRPGLQTPGTLETGAPQPGTGPGAQGRPGAQQTGQQGGWNLQVNQEHVTQIQGALAMRQGPEASKQQLTQVITTIAPRERLSREYVNRFVTDVTAVMPRLQTNPTAQQRLATVIAYIFMPNLQPVQLDAALNDARQALLQAGLQPIQAQTVACDLHLMAAEAHPSLIQLQIGP